VVKRRGFCVNAIDIFLILNAIWSVAWRASATILAKGAGILARAACLIPIRYIVSIECR
jgi:hypothetical protein